MTVTLRSLLAPGILACLVACGIPRDPALGAVEKALRAQIGAAAVVNVGYLRDSTGLLIDFKAATLEIVMVSAGEVLGRGVFRVLHQRTFTAAELR